MEKNKNIGEDNFCLTENHLRLFVPRFFSQRLSVEVVFLRPEIFFRQPDDPADPVLQSNPQGQERPQDIFF